MKRLSERLSERLAQRDMSRCRGRGPLQVALEPARPAVTQPIGKNLDTRVTCHDSKLRYCPGCDNYKTPTAPLWVFGSKVCRFCQRMGRH